MKILVPFNFTPNDQKAIDFVGHRYRLLKEVEVTLFHAYMPIPQIDPAQNPIMEKVSQNTAYLFHQQEERRQALEKAKTQLVALGFAAPLVRCLFVPVKTDVAEDIIRLWQAGGYDEVVLNRNPGSIVNFFSRSISKRIINQGRGGTGVHIVS